MTNKTTFDNIRAWLGEIREYAQEDVVIVLIGELQFAVYKTRIDLIKGSSAASCLLPTGGQLIELRVKTLQLLSLFKCTLALSLSLSLSPSLRYCTQVTRPTAAAASGR